MLFIKDPDAHLDYQFDWTNWLSSGETINTYELQVTGTGAAPDLVIEDDTKSSSNAKVIVWVSGGVLGKKYYLTCRITTNATTPRIDDRTMTFTISNK